MTCRLCLSKAEPFGARDGGYAECGVCGYIQKTIDRLPREEDEKQRYLAHHNDPNDPSYRSWMLGFVQTAVLPWLKPGMRVLDFGCGPSTLMEKLVTQSGMIGSSYDPFFLPETPWSKSQWDAIIMHEVAEHLANPLQTLSMVASCLKPGGILAIRTAFAPQERSNFLSWWYRLDTTHVGFFRARSLQQWATSQSLVQVFNNGVDSITFQDRKTEM